MVPSMLKKLRMVLSNLPRVTTTPLPLTTGNGSKLLEKESTKRTKEPLASMNSGDSPTLSLDTSISAQSNALPGRNPTGPSTSSITTKAKTSHTMKSKLVSNMRPRTTTTPTPMLSGNGSRKLDPKSTSRNQAVSTDWN